MNLKQLFANSEKLDSSEYELGIFIKSRVTSLKAHAANNMVGLDIKTDFNYASAWFDPSKISPVIDKFIKNAIDHTGQKKNNNPVNHLKFPKLANKNYWFRK